MLKQGLQEILEAAYGHGIRYAGKGRVADYIPELAKEDPDRAAAVVTDPSGNRYEVGDAEYRFTVQSIIKVVLYLCVLEHYSFSHIKKYIGVKPSAKPFNSILELELSNKNIPVNPFINAGAIVATSLLVEKYGEKTFDYVLERAGELFGNPNLTYSESIFESERESAFANRALTYMLLNNGILSKETDVEELLKVYFRSCSILVNTRELAALGCLLARGGTSLSGKRHMSEEHARILRTVMATCGTYDYSGDFAVRIGLPAKSGVGGGIVAASKAGYGVGVYCPGLDSHGNSYVGTRILEKLSESLEWSIY